jgi:glycosyltransferase involved in cell wall biosynthesis
MRILFLYTYNKSFLSSFFTELALELSYRNHQIIIASLKKKSGTIIIAPLVSVQILKRKNKLIDYFTIFNLIKREKPDVIISNFSYVNPAILCGKLLGVKLNVVWYHTLTQQLKSSKSQISVKSVFLKKASCIIVNSQYLKTDLKDNYGVLEKRIYPIPFWSALNKEELKTDNIIKSSQIKIGCPGRIEKEKNQQLIISCLADLTTIDWKLFLAGSGSNIGLLRDGLKNNILENRVCFMGVLNLEKMRHFYRSMDLIILPSSFESFGLVLI